MTLASRQQTFHKEMGWRRWSTPGFGLGPQPLSGWLRGNENFNTTRKMIEQTLKTSDMKIAHCMIPNGVLKPSSSVVSQNVRHITFKFRLFSAWIAALNLTLVPLASVQDFFHKERGWRRWSMLPIYSRDEAKSTFILIENISHASIMQQLFARHY